MAEEIREIVDEPFGSVEQVLEDLGRLERVFRDQGDDRAIFATAYRRMTLGMRVHLDGDLFEDPDWVRAYLVAFGEYYRRALLLWEYGEIDHIPDAWELSFGTAERGEALVLQDLVLGVNAHINHDLPFALEDAGVEHGRTRKHRDHDRVNRVIGRVIDAVQDRVVEHYSAALGHLDTLLGPVDETITHFSLTKARDHAWSRGVALTNAPDTDERRRLHSQIDDTTEVLAQIVLAPSRLPAFIEDTLDHVDDDSDWFYETVDDLPPTEALVDGID